MIAFVRQLVEHEGGDLSGRWLAARLSNGATYYRDRLNGTKIFDTNDIGELAALFDTTPQAFMRSAILYAEALDAATLTAGDNEGEGDGDSERDGEGDSGSGRKRRTGAAHRAAIRDEDD